MLKKTLTLLTLLASTLSVNAAEIALDDWWLQTDNCGGIRQSSSGEPVFFAISQSTTWNSNDTYEIPAGYHWATLAEMHALLPTGNDASTNKTSAYFNQCGWDRYTWEGQLRYYFVFSDSATTDIGIHTGNHDDVVQEQTNIIEALETTERFAGLVLIQDPNTVGFVSIAGGTNSGDTITATVTDADGFSNVSYVWMSNGSGVGTDQDSYVTDNSDIGNTITVDVTYTDNLGEAESASSNSIGPIEAVVVPTAPKPGSTSTLLLLMLSILFAGRFFLKAEKDLL
ncbi:MAG: hypothetical protein HRU20_16000 [Pseudomonadales bacterium]|nr:hypothetical protein [Pseudomonadales bacterium]